MISNPAINKCPICDCNVSKTNEKHYDKNVEIRFSLFNCNNCGIQHWSPMKIIPEYYENRSLRYYVVAQSGLNNDIPTHIAPFFENQENMSRGENALDIGCGDGLFIQKLKEYDTFSKIWRK